MFIKIRKHVYSFTNPNKTIWDIVKMETGETNCTKNYITDKRKIGDKLENDYEKFAETFNTHFTSIAKPLLLKIA
jgi:hypothetical protein